MTTESITSIAPAIAPAAANLAPATPEGQLYDGLAGLTGGVAAFYDGQRPSATTGLRKNAYAPHRKLVGDTYADGTSRETVDDIKEGTVGVKYVMPETFVDPDGRRVFFVTTYERAAGAREPFVRGEPLTHELRFQPRSDVEGQRSTHYRWPAGGPVSEVVDGRDAELRAETDGFEQAVKLMTSVSEQWTSLRERQPSHAPSTDAALGQAATDGAGGARRGWFGRSRAA